MTATSHTLHLLLYLAGATQESFAGPVRVRGEFYRAKPIDGDDTVCLRAETDTGPEIGFWSTHACPPPQFDRVRVEGESGALVPTGSGLRIERVGRAPEEVTIAPEKSGGHYLDLYAAIRGASERVTVRLQDTVSFLETYEGAITSSGKIHPVPDSDRERLGEGTDENWVIRDLVPVVAQAFAAGRTFGELGMRWAAQTEWVDHW